ncbi:helix-turn-helix domain-containing protein [Nocardia terpenica]|uniref:Transcriptional regulator n=1 Tax=Nocardia terpenica TaxID=455432 RepID=A0A164I2K9_9NOCA|nr:helix-turn-helix transcriptional regulator [Nocardia terpenica]KZM69045.1 transcriptional regulator [Nocardia terpenica]NQE87859.1 helix-turn-helix domain-containing protein [Nocardia terpenica]
MTGKSTGRPKRGRPRKVVTSSVPRRRLGRYLRDLRVEMGLTIPEVAEQAQRSARTISRYEKGEFPEKIRAAEIREMCAILGAEDAMTEALLGLAQQANDKTWYHQFGELIPENFDIYMGLEANATRIVCYSPDAVIGLLQTEGYARALFEVGYPESSREEIDQRVEMRMRRQRLITRKKNPAKLVVVLGEAALHRIVGNRRVMSAQYKYLADMSTLPNVSIRILRSDAGIPLGHPMSRFVVLGFEEGKGREVEPPIVYIEGYTGDVYLEKKNDVRHYLEAHEAIWRAALDEAESRELLRQLARECRA